MSATDRVFHRETLMDQARLQSSVFDFGACLQKYLPYGHPSALVDKKPVRSGVVGLGQVDRPYAIFRRVSEFIVGALNSVPFRRLPSHVGKEILKAVPSFAYGDPASTVIAVVRIVFIEASLPHSSPCLILCGAFTSFSAASVRESARDRNLFSKTSARLDEAAAQVAPINDPVFAAIAMAHPLWYLLRWMWIIWSSLDHNEPSKPSSS